MMRNKFLFFLMFLCTCVPYLHFGIRADSQSGKPEEICLTNGCIHASSEIMDRLDERIDPCDDFYSFACGGYIQKKTIPDDVDSLNSFIEVSEKLELRLRSILEEPVVFSEPHSFPVRSYYKACMNEERINEEGFVEARTLLNSLGGWPVVEEASFRKADSFNWVEEVKMLKETGLDFNFLLHLVTGKDSADTSRNVIIIDQPQSLGLNTHSLQKGMNDSNVRKYFELMLDTSIMFGAKELIASEEMQAVLNFEIKLSKIRASKAVNRNASYFYNKMTLKEVKNRYGGIDWINLLMHIFPKVKLYDETEILVKVPKYIESLESILKVTPPRTVANYIFWRVVLEIYPFLPQKFEDRFLKFKKAIQGTSMNPPRWKKCFLLTKKQLPILLGAIYIRRFFNDDIKKYTEEMVKNIVAAFKTTIKDKIPWMDENTKLRALEKAEAIEAHVAYNKEILEDTALAEMYSGELHSMEKLFLHSFLILNKHEWNRILGKLLKPAKKNDWREYPAPIKVDAFYSYEDNSIIIPAAILQDVFFNKDRPSYLNYGATGAVIGHELIHAFDDRGSQFDKNGNLKNWWEAATKEAFVEKTKCFINKFDNIRVEEVSGVRTLSENIADNGGAKQAYLAYNSWSNKYGEESKLPGLKYTPRQLFWIAGAQIWCSKERIEYLEQMIGMDLHTPNRYRVNGNYQNLEYFAKDFECPLRSKMNPNNKCSIW